MSYLDWVPATNISDSAPALTMSSLIAFERNPMTKQIRARLTEARKEAARLRLEVNTILAPLFATFKFTDIEGEPIVSEDKLHCTDEDCSTWDNARHEALTAAGYDTTDHSCPALVAEYAQIKAEHALLAHATATLGGADYSNIWNMELRREVIETLMTGPATR